MHTADDTHTAMDQGQFLPFHFTGGRVFALGMTYADHRRETGEKPQTPVVFLKHCVPLSASQATLATPAASAIREAIDQLEPDLADWLGERFGTLPALLDYEVEIGMVMLEDVSRQQLNDTGCAPPIGLFVANDLTTRTVQIAGEGSVRKLDFWTAAKSFADFLPVGDRVWCAHTPQLDSLPSLTLETRVNGLVRQSASTHSLLYTPRQLLQYAVQHAPDGVLRRHDLILTGTPAGVALRVPAWKRRLAALLPRRQRIRAAIRSNLHNAQFLRPGDVLTFSAGWLGSRTLTIH